MQTILVSFICLMHICVSISSVGHPCCSSLVQHAHYVIVFIYGRPKKIVPKTAKVGISYAPQLPKCMSSGHKIDAHLVAILSLLSAL